MNLSKNVKLSLVKDLTATGGTAVNSASVDMQGFEGVMFFVKLATANAANFINAAQSADDVTFNDLLGSKVVPGDNGDVAMIDVYRPIDRHVRLEVDRGGADTVLGEIYAVQYGGKNVPVTHGSTVDSETHISPAEGTA